MSNYSPRALYELYSGGFAGCRYEPEHMEKLMESLKYPYFSDANYSIRNTGKGKLSTPFRSVLRFDKLAYEERQTTGDCFVSGSKVRMGDGSLKNIEEIKIGEYVISGFGNKRRVTNVFHKPYDANNRPLVRLKTNEYCKELIATPDHKLLTENGIEKAIVDLKEDDKVLMPSINSIYNNISFDMSDFCETEYVDEKTDYKGLRLEPVKAGYIRAKNGRNSIKKHIPMSEKLAWLVGLYAAEGSNDGVLRNERITYNLGSHEAIMAQKVKQYFKDVFDIDAKVYQVPSKPTVIYVRIHNIMIAKLFKYLCSGNTYSKKLAKEWFVSPLSCQLALACGWFDGDGNKEHTQGTSVSQDLILDIVDILNNIGIDSKIYEREEFFDGISNHVKSYICYINKNSSQSLLSQTINVTGLSNSFGRYTTVKSIEIINQDIDTVYCIEVEHDHNFICNGYGSKNCVSHGTRNAVDVTRAVEIHVGYEREAWVARGATEPIYGSRGHGGQGMSCSRAAEFVSKIGGLLVRRNYEGVIDLSKYNSSIGSRWGSVGVPESVKKIGQDHQIKTVSKITTIEEARDALANGYGINVCSGYGFSRTRDNKGIARPSGGWSHAMAWTACDDTGSEPLFLVQNSWGCYSDDTEVLTKKGWKLFKDILNSDILATLNPKNHNLEWQQVQEKFEYDYNGYLNHYHFRGVDLLVTDNHKMYVGKLHSDLENPNSWELIESRDCPKYMHIKKDAQWRGEEISNITIGKHVIPMDLWLEFLGYFISEGHSCNHKKVMSNGEIKSYGLIGISQSKKESREIIQNCISMLPFKFSKNMISYDKYLYDELKKYGKAHEKYVPDYVKNLCSRQQKIFFEAMMLGDGSRSNGKINYYTSSKQLADDMQEVVLKIGMSADIIEVDRIGRDNGKNNQKNITKHKEYRLNIKEISLTPRESAGTTPLLLPYNGKIYCATVPNHIMYVRRNGRAVWCGNSWNSGGHPDWGKIPDGSFLITADVAAGMLRGGGSFAFSSFDGFPLQKLPDYGFDYL